MPSQISSASRQRRPFDSRSSVLQDAEYRVYWVPQIALGGCLVGEKTRLHEVFGVEEGGGCECPSTWLPRDVNVNVRVGPM